MNDEKIREFRAAKMRIYAIGTFHGCSDLQQNGHGNPHVARAAAANAFNVAPAGLRPVAHQFDELLLCDGRMPSSAKVRAAKLEG